MKFLILDAQINFYLDNGFIEFENFFSDEKIKILENTIDTLTKKDKKLPPIDQYKASHDLFRKSEIIKKIALNTNLINTAKALSKKEPLRLIFDQFLSGSYNPFEKMASLNDISSFQNLYLATIIKINSNPSIAPNLPKKQGSVMFLKTSSLIDFESIFSNDQKFLLICYGDMKTIYVHNKKDPNLDFLKQFGYNFSDTLKDKFHPLVF